ncbi:hypothetical protein N7495_007508 [Penicillium taxi]|uniref:uncharacterized protein n=1 Tax=Penicillium taxi TaxID=168475 RepID=UPI0025458D8E|nr:uncharacterized protein N7495_007508 [Penicillium taxi]KAJ5887467.1 hypothetical protein N7495_007508 [Penicillium taxi]
MAPNEHQISLAISDLKSGQISSVKAAAIAYGVSRSTLTRRMNGSLSRRDAHSNQQRLSPGQEEFLVKWILERDSQGFPPSHACAREMAARILRSNGDNEPLGKAWLPKFIQRNPRVNSCIGRRIDVSRIHGTQPAAIQEFYELFAKTKE